MYTINKRNNIERNRVFHLEDSMIMYGVYNVDTLEKIDTNGIQMMNNRSVWYEKLYAGQVNNWFEKVFSQSRYKLFCHTFIIIFKNHSIKIHKDV